MKRACASNRNLISSGVAVLGWVWYTVKNAPIRRGKLWTDSYMGLCEWDGTRWLMEDFEPYKKYKGENIIITAWSDIEPYKDR